MKRILGAALALSLLMQPAACRAETMDAQEAALPIVEMMLPAAQEEMPAAPMQTPAAEETEDGAPTMELPATQAPIAEATAEPTANPTENPAETPTEVPTAEVPMPSPAPEETQAPELPPQEGVTAVSCYEEIPGDAQAWMPSGEMYICGSLEKLILRAEAQQQIYLRSADVMELKAASLRHLASLKLLPDDRIFADGAYRAAASMESPERVEASAEVDLAQWIDAETDMEADLFVWVVKEEGAPTQPPEETKLIVSSEDCRPGEWSNVHPTFHLSGIPEGKNWVYAAVIYDERIAVLSGDSYAAEEEGVYTLRFVILDELGDIADASEKYTLWLDHTLPEVSVSMDEEKDYTLHLDMADGMSGLGALSMDSGASWTELNGADSERYTISGRMTIGAGMLQVRDRAGNTWISAESYELTKLPGGGSGGGGDGSTMPVKQHASETGGDGKGAQYNALAMQLPGEPMHALNIDGQVLALTLELANAEGFDVPGDYQPCFTAELAAWAADEAGEETEEKAERPMDTLLLTAVEEENLGDRFEYRWRFNGEVYRLLANSGICYLALQVGEDIAVFPTEGFVGGTKYTELKMLGVSTRRFDYTVAMSFNLDPGRIPKLSACDFSENCDLAILAEVENARYVLSDEQRGEMYACGVYLGPAEMMEVPYGTYGA